MSDQTCRTCAHAVEVEPRWRRHGAVIEDCCHCRAFRVPTATLIRNDQPCTFQPSRWEHKREA